VDCQHFTAYSGLETMFSRSPYPYSLFFMQYYTAFPSLDIQYTLLSVKPFHCSLSNSTVYLSRTAHNAGWDAHISVQNHEAAHQYHCPGLHSVTTEIRECKLTNTSYCSHEGQFITL